MARYDLTDKQFARLMKASQPVAMIALQCGSPTSPRERAEAVWREVAAEHGCNYDTIQPYPGEPRSFIAEALAIDPALHLGRE